MPHTCSYQETIAYLYGLQKHGIKLSLHNIARLMETLGGPHRKFPSVHVAGTNGKGSTSAFIARVLQSAGYRVGLYTSPHLVHFGERILIQGERISEQDVIRLAKQVRKAAESTLSDGASLNPTFFEVTTAMALMHFAEKRVDIAVIETGMGGRLDATNIVTPLVSVITNIDLEHTEFLGHSLEAIAGEKAGIIKERVPLVTAAHQPEVISVLQHATESKHALLSMASRDFFSTKSTSSEGQAFDYQGIDSSYQSLRIGMLGEHQIDNAGLAVAAVEWLRRAGFAIDEQALRRGLLETRWQGRLERIAEQPDVFLDGAHNPASAKKLAAAAKELKKRYNRMVLLIGVLSDKDYPGILAELLPLADHVIATQPNYVRSLDAEVLEREIKKKHRSVEKQETCADAIERALRGASHQDLILITGSLYVVGEARSWFLPDESASQALSVLKG